MPGPRGDLRGAVYRGDGLAVVTLLADPGRWPVHGLQLAGDGLLAALAASVAGTESLARRCVEELRGRGWEGDGELAEALSARLGDAPTPLLRPLPIDLEELASTLEGDPAYGGGRIDLRTGEVWPEMALDDLEEDGDDEEDGGDADGDEQRWLWVESQGSRPGYRDMEAFIADLDDPDQADRLEIAITGRGAFRRFKDVIARWPDLAERWFAFAEDRTRGRARAWLADAGYTPTPPGPRG